jgi:hypothetical protein
LDPTFIATTTGTLLVTGNSTFQGLVDAEIIVGTLISGSNFTGQESKPSLSTTSQKNTSTNNAAYAGLEAINNNNGTVGIYSYGSSHATRPTSAWLETTNPLKVKGSTTSLFAGTNENLVCSGTNVQLPFLTASRPVSTDASNNLVSASVTGTGSTVLQTSPTLTTPNIGAASGTSLQLSGTLGCTTVTASGVVSGTKFRGDESVAGFSASYQKNSNSAGATSIAVFNNADSELSLSITGTTSSNTSTIYTDRPLEIISDSSINLQGTLIADSLSPSLPVSTNASKNLVSASVTGTGSTVLQTSPTLTTPNIGAASGTSLNLSGLTGGLQYAVHSNASKDLISVFNSGSGNNIMSASPTFTGTIQCAGINGTANFVTVGTVTGRTTLNLTGSSSGTVSVSVQAAAGTFNFNLPVTAGSTGDVLTSAGGGATAMTWTGSTGTGNFVRATSASLTTPSLGAATATSLTFTGSNSALGTLIGATTVTGTNITSKRTQANTNFTSTSFTSLVSLTLDIGKYAVSGFNQIQLTVGSANLVALKYVIGGTDYSAFTPYEWHDTAFSSGYGNTTLQTIFVDVTADGTVVEIQGRWLGAITTVADGVQIMTAIRIV